jgi:PAS domain S-box-containing protein
MEEHQQNSMTAIDELHTRLQEAEDTLQAIRAGEIDALVVTGPLGEKVFILRGADHPYRVIVEEMNEGAITLSPDGTILYCNQRFADLLKAPLEQVIGSSIEECFVREEAFESLAQKNVRGTAEGHLQRADGARVPVFISYNPVVIDDANTVCLIVADLTELKHQTALLEEERLRSEEKIRENQRLAVMGATAAVLTHEIANPLNGISITVQVMQRHLLEQSARSGEDDFLSSNLADLKLEIDRLGALLNDFRSLARRPRLHVAPIDLGALVDEVLKMLSSEAESSGVEVAQEIPPDLPVLHADSERLKQVFLNLFKNAIEAMPSGGKLTVSALAQERDIIMNIADTGSGIPEGVDIFQPFMTTKAHGTGVGMAVVRELLSAHGGTISYKSKRGQGTMFEIKLPLSPPPPNLDDRSPIPSVSF